MKTQISRNTFDPNQPYSGVYMQQGRMIVDADWNELSDIAKSRLDLAMKDAVASGAPRVGGLSIAKSGSNFLAMPGILYAEGVRAELRGAASGVVLNAQPNYPNPPAFSGANLRIYADVWERSVTGLEDSNLLDPGLHGADTATRSQTMLQIKWCDTAIDPLSSPDNRTIGNAPLKLALRQILAAGDPCDPCAAEIEVDERVGNYLFRVEVHDVFLDAGNTIVVLKWSRDNGAEAYPVAQMPEDFDQGDWVWEFFDTATEKQLGNHFPLTHHPRRGIISETFAVPVPATAPKTFVRQWDGYVEINLDTNALRRGRDRGTALQTSGSTTAHGFMSIAAGVLRINLELLELELALAGNRFVTGDYWLADVREAVDTSGSYVLGSLAAGVLPQGVVHHYVELARVDAAGNVVAQSDALRRQMHFPPLSNILASDVGFTPTCADLYGSAANVQQALDALCGIGAEDIGYTPPTCPTPNTVNTLFASSIAGWPNVDGLPKNPSVKDMLDALLCSLNAGTVPYNTPTCAGSPSPTVRELLGLAAGDSTIAQALNQLLCNLNADRIPLDKSTIVCDVLNTPEITTVQDALDRLCATRTASCAQAVAVGEFETVLAGFAADERTDIWLCLQPGTHILSANLNVPNKRSIRISAAAAAATTIEVRSAGWVMQANELGLEGVQIYFQAGGNLRLQGERTSISRCIFRRATSNPSAAPMLRLEPRSDSANAVVFVRDNVLSDTWSRVSPSGGVLGTVGVVGNAVLAERFMALNDDPTIFGDPVRFNQAVDAIAAQVASMPAAQRTQWQVNAQAAIPVMRAAPAKKTSRSKKTSAPLVERPISIVSNLGNSGSILAGSNFTASNMIANAALLENVSGSAVSAAAVRDDVLNYLAVLYETGWGVGLGVSSHRISGEFSGNRINAVLRFMNSQTGGTVPVSITGVIASIADIVQSGGGDIAVNDNQIGRIEAWVPTAAISNGSLNQAVLGFSSIRMSANFIGDENNCMIGQLVSAQSNQFIGSNTTGTHRVATSISNWLTLTGNMVNVNAGPSAVFEWASSVATSAFRQSAVGNLMTVHNLR